MNVQAPIQDKKLKSNNRSINPLNSNEGYLSLAVVEEDKQTIEFSEIAINSGNSIDKMNAKFSTFNEIFTTPREQNNPMIYTNVLKLLVSLLLFLCWIFLYLSSLFGCFKSQAECLKELKREVVLTLGVLLYSSALIFVIFAILTVYNKVYRIIFYFSFPVMYYLFGVYDTGADLSSHGAYNRVFFYVFVIVTSVFIGLIYVLIKSLLKFPKMTAFTAGVIFLILFVSIKESIRTSCDYWNKGFKNSTIEKGGACNIPVPSTCFLYYTSNFFDVSRIRGMNSCENQMSSDYLLRKYTNRRGVNKLGFPRSEYMPHFPDSTLTNWYRSIFRKMVDMEKDTNLAKDVEVYIDYTKNKPEAVIELKKNETLIAERSELYENYKNQTTFKNILYIYIDSLSRNHFKRKLQKTYKWIESHYKNEDSKLSSYQFLKYQSLNYFTYANMIPALFGTPSFEGKGRYFLHSAKKVGYITGQSYDVCGREVWDLELAFQPYVDFTNYDHEFNSFYCDPTFADPKVPYSPLKGAYSITRKCMYGKDAGEHQIEYAKQFFDTYKDQAKIFRLAFIDSHEGTGEVIKFMDEPIFNFLKYLESNGHLENTLIQFQSDHGMTMTGPIYLINPNDFFFEVFLPSLFYVLPKSTHNFKEIDQNLLSNENRMITCYDTHASLLSLFANEDKVTQQGVSLFYKTAFDEKRTCDQFHIKKKFCMCHYGEMSKYQ